MNFFSTIKYKKSAIIIVYIFLLIMVCNLVYEAKAIETISSDLATENAKQTGAFTKAAGIEQVGTEGQAIEIVATIIQIFLGFLGIIFVILIIYGGYLWMTSRGNEEQVKKAKDTLQKATIGLIIILAAYAITYFVFTELPFSGGSGSGGPESSGE